MDTFYPVKHWLLTILIGPIIICIYTFLFLGGGDILGFLGAYFIYIIMAMIFSLPVLAVYYIVFYLLKDNIPSPIRFKTVLNLVTILGIFITFKILDDDSEIPVLIICFSISAIISSWLLKIKKDQPVADIVSESK